MTYVPASGWIVHYARGRPLDHFAFHVTQECAQQHAASLKAAGVQLVGPMTLAAARTHYLIRECAKCVPQHRIDNLNMSIFEPPLLGAAGLGKRR